MSGHDAGPMSKAYRDGVAQGFPRDVWVATGPVHQIFHSGDRLVTYAPTPCTGPAAGSSIPSLASSVGIATPNLKATLEMDHISVGKANDWVCMQELLAILRKKPGGVVDGKPTLVTKDIYSVALQPAHAFCFADVTQGRLARGLASHRSATDDSRPQFLAEELLQPLQRPTFSPRRADDHLHIGMAQEYALDERHFAEEIVCPAPFRVCYPVEVEKDDRAHWLASLFL